MCFAPQWRALFRNPICQKWSEHGVFCTFWLGNVLRATTACTFSTSQLPKVPRTWGVFSFSTCKCASRHNGVQFFISHLASWIRTAALASLLFNPPEPQIIGKTQCFATFLPFRAPGSSFFSDFLFCDLLSSFCFLLLFSSLLFSDSSHLCFSSVHIVGSLTSKLPSMNIYERPFKQQTLTILSRRDCAIEALRHRAQTQGLGLEETFECLMRLMQKT